MTHRYMMATKAVHKLGDISRKTPDLCRIAREDGDDWIGSWVDGYGFVEVRFPKATTRDLTAEEVARYNGRFLTINGSPWGKLDISTSTPTSAGGRETP